VDLKISAVASTTAVIEPIKKFSYRHTGTNSTIINITRQPRSVFELVEIVGSETCSRFFFDVPQGNYFSFYYLIINH